MLESDPGELPGRQIRFDRRREADTLKHVVYEMGRCILQHRGFQKGSGSCCATMVFCRIRIH